MMKRFLLCAGIIAAAMVAQSASATVTVTEQKNDPFSISYTVDAQGLGSLSLVAFAIDFTYGGNILDLEATNTGGFAYSFFVTGTEELPDYFPADFEGDDEEPGNITVVFTNPDNDDGDATYTFEVSGPPAVEGEPVVEEASTPLVGCAENIPGAGQGELQDCVGVTVRVPEPASMGLMGLGFIGFLLGRRKFK